KGFWGLSLKLSPATLVPRPDTETLVELALEILRDTGAADRPLRIADLGTGAILLALLSELPQALGVGTDISTDALQTAEANAARAGLSDRTSFVTCDNADLAAEVREHDPKTALDGGPDGLDAYRALIPQGACLLAPGAALVVEAGRGQSGDIEALMRAAGLICQWPPKADLAGIRRAVAGLKLPP